MDEPGGPAAGACGRARAMTHYDARHPRGHQVGPRRAHPNDLPAQTFTARRPGSFTGARPPNGRWDGRISGPDARGLTTSERAYCQRLRAAGVPLWEAQRRAMLEGRITDGADGADGADTGTDERGCGP